MHVTSSSHFGAELERYTSVLTDHDYSKHPSKEYVEFLNKLINAEIEMSIPKPWRLQSVGEKYFGFMVTEYREGERPLINITKQVDVNTNFLFV